MKFTHGLSKVSENCEQLFKEKKMSGLSLPIRNSFRKDFGVFGLIEPKGEQSESDSEREQHGIAIAERKQPKPPSLYKVVILNDDYTPMDFVVAVLMKYFNKSSAEATEIMYAVHEKGRGTCGIYPYDIAETKSRQVCEHARTNGHPLQAIVERDA